jgi:predicted nuclease of restriction endonuclease-like (RecB) superfamily
MKSKRTAASRLPATYAPWLAAVKDRVRSAQLQAAARVNHELLRLYWEIGASLLDTQQHQGWGKAVIPRLAHDLHLEFPNMQGFSERNLSYMLRFAREYGPPPILQQPAAKLSRSAKVQPPAAQIAADLARALIVPPPAAQLAETISASSILQQAAAKLPWSHHLVLMEKVKNRADRLWYMQAAVEHGWSRSVLTVQIEQRAHARAGRAVTNFAATLPPPQSDLAQQTLKDPYLFDFLTLGPAARDYYTRQNLLQRRNGRAAQFTCNRAEYETSATAHRSPAHASSPAHRRYRAQSPPARAL